jgi:hypothetical protein
MNRIYLGCVLLLALAACQDASIQPDRTPVGTPESLDGTSGALSVTPGLSRPIFITTNQLPEGRAGVSYLATLTAIGGNRPLTWKRVSGALPGGLTFAPNGTLSGMPTSEVRSTLIVEATDGTQSTRKALGLVIHPGLVVTTETLPRATEGITWLSAPGVAVRLAVRGGTPPFTFSAGPLPEGLGLNAADGTLSGVPAQGSAGRYAVTVRVSDAAGASTERGLPLDVLVPRPILGGGTASRPPLGSPLTDTLTVFTVDGDGRRRAGVGVRVRKNGQEYDPPRQALSDASGKVVFTGLGLNGVTDTVDLTANGRGLQNVTMAKVNAALVTLALEDWSLPMPRTDFVAAADPASGRLLVTSGLNALGTWGCIDNVVELDDANTNTWHEPLLHGMPGTMPASAYAAGAFARGAFVVFGGLTCRDFVPIPETWEYAPDTRTWSRWPAAGPEPRSAPVMTPDDTGERVLLFGGQSQESWDSLDDTWVYAPATHTWERRFPSGPIPLARGGAAAAFDSLRAEMVVCGGRNPLIGGLSDCNAYSPANNTWRPLPPLPSPREDFSMAFHAASGELYAFGGRSAGMDRGDLLVLRDGTWVTQVADGAQGAPPRLHGHALVADARSGLLLLLGGARQVDNRISHDVWTFEPASGQWTWRNAPPPSSPTVRLSGSLSGGPSGSNVRATVTVAGNGGYVNLLSIPLVDGRGSYELVDVPSDETLSVRAHVTVRSSSPGVLWSYVDLGLLGPLTADTSRDIAFPPGPLPVNTTTATFVLPSSWTAFDSWGGGASQQRPGFRRVSNGLIRTNRTEDGLSLSYDTVPLQPGATQWFTAILYGQVPPSCVATWLSWDGASGGPPAVPSPSTGLAPGVAECLGGEPPEVVESSWSLTPPAGMQLLWVGIGAAEAPDDWLYIAPLEDLPVAFQLPEPSTLAPSRPMPPGQRVSWYAATYQFTTNSFDYNDFSVAWTREDTGVRVEPYVYVRARN